MRHETLVGYRALAVDVIASPGRLPVEDGPIVTGYRSGSPVRGSRLASRMLPPERALIRGTIFFTLPAYDPSDRHGIGAFRLSDETFRFATDARFIAERIRVSPNGKIVFVVTREAPESIAVSSDAPSWETRLNYSPAWILLVSGGGGRYVCPVWRCGIYKA